VDVNASRTVALLSALSTALVGLAAVPAPAAGAPAGVTAHSPRTSAATAQRAATYWTRERMLAAEPVPVPVLTPDAVKPPTGPQGPPGRVNPVRPPGRAVQASPFADPGAEATAWPGPATSWPAATMGRIFYTDSDGRDNSCSGTAIGSPSKRVVFTAGHCVARYGQWFNLHPWTFVPGYDNGNAPFGQWTAWQLWTMTAWLFNDDRTQDLGAAVMNTNGSGQQLGDVVGGMGIEWNWPFNQYEFQFGYPARYPFNGSTLMHCTGDTFDDAGFEGINCDMNWGASGGAWLDDFSGTYGWLNGVNSWLFYLAATGRVYKWNSPYFGDNVGGLYDAVAYL